MSNIIEFQNISKFYPGVIANDNISFSIKQQSIHAILGENGAGKSTLVKILYGHSTQDSGQILINSKKIEIKNPFDAKKLGINMVFQHFSLFESLSVYENLILGIDENLSFKELKENTVKICTKYGFNLNLDSPVSSLSVGERQTVEIVRALLNKPKILILDEPTSVLTPFEIDRLFNIIKKLVKDGLTVLFISHKLEEIINLTNYVTILRSGKVVGTYETHQESPDSLGYKMLGYEVPALDKKQSINSKKPTFEIKNLSTINNDPFSVNLKNINLQIKKGEIMGIAGVAGNGQNELMNILTNESDENFQGEIIFKDINISKLSTYERRKLSISFVTEQRLGHSAVPEMTLEENVLLSLNFKSEFTKNTLINFNNISDYTKKIIKEFNVSAPSSISKAGELSGGNLQKFIIGREILSNPDLLILSQPTWGIDVGSESFIRKSLLELSEKGISILIISHDIEELIELCHQISVIYQGKISKSLTTENIDMTQLGKYMGGMFD